MKRENASNKWVTKGATFSDKNARTEYGISQEEIIAGINSGKLEHRVNYIHGNPYYKLIKDEVESLVKEKYGESYVEKMKLTTKLKKVNSDLRKLKKQTKLLVEDKEELERKLREIG